MVGLGLMGSSIATCLLAAGHHVTALDKKPAEENKGIVLQRIRSYLKEMKKEDLIDEKIGDILSRLTITDEIKDLTAHQLVFEAIFENVTEKQKLFHNLENVLPADAIIGTNTSAIPISILQDGLKHPRRLIGIHWAEPAHITRFMEVICGSQTELGYAEQIVSMAKNWNKEPSLLKKDIRGFITNRIMYAMLREAFHLVEGGYATIEDIDRSLRNDLGYWITFAGPFRFMDLTGIPAYLAVMRDLFGELDNSSKVPPMIEELVAQGAKGTSNAHGFYQYTAESAKNWERQFIAFSYDIRKLAAKYSNSKDRS